MTDVPANPSSPRPPSAPASSSSVPPHPLDGEWYIHVNGQTYGPYPGHRLSEFQKEGRIDGATQVLAVGTENWVHASEDRYLAPIFRQARQQQPQTLPPVTAAAGATVVQVTNQIAPQPIILMDDMGAFGPKSPGVALLLSFLFCGAGQMYCGRVGKGIAMFFGCLFLWLILLGWTIWIWSMIDAYATAKDMNLRYLRRLQLGQVV